MVSSDTSYISNEDTPNEIRIIKSRLAKTEKELDKYKTWYYNLLQLHEIGGESKHDKIWVHFKDEELSDSCKYCKQNHEENIILHEKISKVSVENNRVLSSFHDLFTQLQNIQKENRELLQRLNEMLKETSLQTNTQEFGRTSNNEGDEKLSIKQMEIDELKSFIQKNIKDDRSNSESPELSKQNSHMECKECTNKQSDINAKESIIKELQDLSNPPSYQKKAPDLHINNKNLQVLKERIRAKIIFIRNLLGEPKQVIVPGQKALVSLIEKRQSLERWWNCRSDFAQESDWIREGQQLIAQTCSSAKEALDLKPVIKGRPGRDLRMTVHKQVIEIEQAFNEIGQTTPVIQDIKLKFLELPYLLKPIFDLMKEYEQQNSGVELSQDLKLDSALNELKLLQDSLSDQPSLNEGRDQFAPVVRRNSKRHRTNA